MNPLVALQAKQNEMLNIFGYYIHYVPLSESIQNEYPLIANIHTHGLQENFDHPDLEIVCDIGYDQAWTIFDRVASRIKEGRKIEPETPLLRFFLHAPLHIVKSTDGERELRRLVIPDREGNYLKTSIHPEFAFQYEDLTKYF